MKAQNAQRFWDRVSKLSKNPKRLGAVARKTIDSASVYLSDDRAVLDVGCGTGDLTIAIARKVASVYAMDSSLGMIEVAKSKAKDNGTENIDFVVADLSLALPKRCTFTVVTALNVLHYIEDISHISRKINELLNPEGLFISSTACLSERKTFLSGLTVALTKLRIMPKVHLFKLNELKSLITSGGFEIIETKKLSPLPEYFIVAKKVV